jgi:hypothetical protein
MLKAALTALVHDHNALPFSGVGGGGCFPLDTITKRTST